jgi:hypothetical protein
LADDDFEWFDTTSNKFAVTSEAAKRLSKRIYGKIGIGEPYKRANGVTYYDLGFPLTAFVLEARGYPVYVGEFACPENTAAYEGIPVVATWSEFVEPDFTNDVEFDIKFNPSRRTNSSPDPRNDKEIIKAVAQLFHGTNNAR